jgi:hypothetical protein
LQEPPDARGFDAAAREQQRAEADDGRADRHDAARAEPVHRDARDEAERGIAVVEEPGDRRDTERR